MACLLGCVRAPANECNEWLDRPRSGREDKANPFAHAQEIPGRDHALRSRAHDDHDRWACTTTRSALPPALAAEAPYAGCTRTLAVVPLQSDSRHVVSGAMVCPEWLESYVTAMFSAAYTRDVRRGGRPDACCYETHYRVYDAGWSPGP